MITMGSLFDVIGGFPLAAVRNGIVPLWASEIEAFPIEVTQLRFPDIHVGDITALNGAELPVVDIICGGSPCQDLSVAGARAGLAGARSGLFMEQVRIVKEMRANDELGGRTDHAIRPRYMVWENVPGAFSSGEPKGEDFRIVLEEIVRIKSDSLSVPRPDSGKWESAGRILLGTDFSLAWRILDAQYWGVASSLSQILEAEPHPRYYLSRTACLGILRRASERGKELPPQLKAALMMQAGLAPARPSLILPGDAYHINQRNEGIDLDGVSGALMHTQNMQMQTFVTQPEEPVGFDGYNGDLTGDRAATLGVNCGMSTGRNGVITFAANQRDEVRDLHDIAGALGAQPGMKQQTFVADGCLTPWDTQQERIFLPDGVAPTMAGADGGGGRNPAGLLFSAAFCAGASPTAGGIGYTEEGSPTLKAAESGTNMVPAVVVVWLQLSCRMVCLLCFVVCERMRLYRKRYYSEVCGLHTRL